MDDKLSACIQRTMQNSAGATRHKTENNQSGKPVSETVTTLPGSKSVQRKKRTDSRSPRDGVKNKHHIIMISYHSTSSGPAMRAASALEPGRFDGFGTN